MNLLDRGQSWLMHKLSVAIKSKWHPQAMITAENYLDKLKVLHQSENFLAVDKMADLVMNTNPGDERLSLFDQIKHRFPHLHQPGLGHGFYVLHRLDYSTSGVLVVPLSREAATQGSKQFEKRRTKKFYLALLRGHVEEDRVDIDIPIGKDASCEQRMCCPDEPNCDKARVARTRLVVLSRGEYSGSPATKVLLAPVTGRRHQLRIHCHRLGNTIVGDFTYSGKRDVLPPRMYLHAHRLLLPTPLEELDINAGDPFDSSEDAAWKPGEGVCTIDQAYLDIHDEALSWAKLDLDPPQS